MYSDSTANVLFIWSHGPPPTKAEKKQLHTFFCSAKPQPILDLSNEVLSRTFSESGRITPSFASALARGLCRMWLKEEKVDSVFFFVC